MWWQFISQTNSIREITEYYTETPETSNSIRKSNEFRLKEQEVLKF